MSRISGTRTTSLLSLVSLVCGRCFPFLSPFSPYSGKSLTEKANIHILGLLASRDSGVGVGGDQGRKKGESFQNHGFPCKQQRKGQPCVISLWERWWGDIKKMFSVCATVYRQPDAPEQKSKKTCAFPYSCP